MAPKIAEGMAAGRKSHRKKESSGGGITGKIISKILKRGPKGSSKTSQHNLTRKPHLPFASHISSSLRAGPAGTSTESASAGNDDADWLQYKRKNSSRRCIGGLSSSNAGVFCYINTSIQALAATRFPEWLDTHFPDPCADNAVRSLKAAFTQVNRYRIDNGSHNLDALKQFSGETPTPEDLELPDDFRNLKPMGHDYLQSNTTEFLAALWNVIGSKAPAAALIQHPFGGALIERFMCCNCNDVWWKPGFSMIPIESETGAMLDLTKPIPRSKSEQIRGNLSDCFDEFTAVRLQPSLECHRCITEIIIRILNRALGESGLTADQVSELNNRKQGMIQLQKSGNRITEKLIIDNGRFLRHNGSYHCGLPGTKQKMFTQFSDILILEFSNTCIREPGTSNKTNSRVRYPATIDLSKWCVGPNLRTDSFSASMKPEDADLPADIFELRAALIHSGEDVSAGHWYCYRREWHGAGATDQWWYCNEGDTIRARRQDVFLEGGLIDFGNGPTNEAVLVYERLKDGMRRPDPEPKSPVEGDRAQPRYPSMGRTRLSMK